MYKDFSFLHIAREIQAKATGKYHFTSVGMSIIFVILAWDHIIPSLNKMNLSIQSKSLTRKATRIHECLSSHPVPAT